MRDAVRRSLAATLLAFAGLLATPPEVSAQEIVVITGVAVGIPRPPNGGTWDDVLSSPGGLKSIYPDIRICLESQHVPPSCLPVCPNADWVESGSVAAFVCRHQTQIIVESNLSVTIQDVDGNRVQPVWQGSVPNPGTCVGKACAFKSAGGTVQVEFQFGRIDFASYQGPIRGTFAPPRPATRAPAPAPPPAAPAVTVAPAVPPAVSEPSYWERFKDGWDRFWGYFSPADTVEAFCTVAHNVLLDWACSVVEGPVRDTENALISRIACLRGALGTRRQIAEASCRQHPDGSIELENCLLMYFDDPPVQCMPRSGGH
jgi:hypothetical protein